MWPVYRSLWARLDRVHGSQLAAGEGATFADHERIVSERGDLPVTPEEHVAWLRAAGFEAAILYLHAPRAVIAARKV
jgi:hypothetical protein